MQAGSFSDPACLQDYFGLNGCFAVFDPAMTSAAVGLPLSARSMDSLVAL